MNKVTFEINKFEPKKSSTELMESYLDFMERVFKENYPEDNSFYERERVRKEILNPYELLDYYYWIIIKYEKSKKTVIGTSSFYISNKKNPDYNKTKHSLWFQLFVDKKYRRHGWGKKLLQKMVEKIVRLERITIVQTFSLHESGWKFCERNGGKLALEAAYNRLKLSNVNWKEMTKWVNQGEKSAKEKKRSLEIYRQIPASIIKEFTEVFTEIGNLVPLGDLEEETVETPESRRTKEQLMDKLGIINISLITRENDGRISGITEIQYSKEIPYLVEQDITGVLPKYRGQGIGKWLKAAMLLYIRDNFPEVTTINTGNADSNAPMLSINERMGFRKHLTEKCYKFQLEDLVKLFRIS